MKRSERLERTRTCILEAAARCFRRRGIQGSSIDEVAVEAGVTKPTVYNHFGSKDGLSQALARSWFVDSAKSRMPRFDPCQDVGPQLRAIAGAHMHELTDPDHLGLLRAYFAELMARPAWGEQLLGSMPADELPGFLATAHDAGALHIQDAERAAALFWASIKGALFYPALFGVLPNQTAAARGQLIAEAVRIFVAGHSAADTGQP